MRRVVAQGTFDLLHTGHLQYLREAAQMGDELIVIVARRANVTHKPSPILPGAQRREIVGALRVVDRAILGDPEDIFVPIQRIRPDIIALGYDQHHDEDELATALADRGIDCEIRRATKRAPRHDQEMLSSRDIIDRILERRG